MDETNDIKLILYGLNSMENKNTMRNIISHNNDFLNNMTIISIFGVTTAEEEENVYVIFSEPEYISGMKKTRKAEEEFF